MFSVLFFIIERRNVRALRHLLESRGDFLCAKSLNDFFEHGIVLVLCAGGNDIYVILIVFRDCLDEYRGVGIYVVVKRVLTVDNDGGVVCDKRRGKRRVNGINDEVFRVALDVLYIGKRARVGFNGNKSGSLE